MDDEESASHVPPVRPDLRRPRARARAGAMRSSARLESSHPEVGAGDRQEASGRRDREPIRTHDEPTISARPLRLDVEAVVDFGLVYPPAARTCPPVLQPQLGRRRPRMHASSCMRAHMRTGA